MIQKLKRAFRYKEAFKNGVFIGGPDGVPTPQSRRADRILCGAFSLAFIAAGIMGAFKHLI